MRSNMGNLDRVGRIIVGFILLAFALRIGFPQTGWNWLVWIGLVPILTAIFRYCPAYGLLGVKTS